MEPPPPPPPPPQAPPTLRSCGPPAPRGSWRGAGQSPSVPGPRPAGQRQLVVAAWGPPSGWGRGAPPTLAPSGAGLGGVKTAPWRGPGARTPARLCLHAPAAPSQSATLSRLGFLVKRAGAGLFRALRSALQSACDKKMGNFPLPVQPSYQPAFFLSRSSYYPCFHPPIHPFTLPYTDRSILSCIHPALHPSILPSFHLSTRPSIHSPIHPPIYPLIHPFIFSFLPSLSPFLSLPIPPFHLSILLSFQPSIHPLITPSGLVPVRKVPSGKALPSPGITAVRPQEMGGKCGEREVWGLG